MSRLRVYPRWLRLAIAGLLSGLLLLLAIMVQAQGTRLPWVYIHQAYLDKTGPQVTAEVTVHRPDGLPARGLTVENFQIQEAGEPSKAPLAVQETQDQPLQLVLAIDLSMNFREDLAGVKSAALALVEQLQPQDHLTVITFYNELHQPDNPLFEGFLQDPAKRQKLRQDIAGLDVTGDHTALFQAAQWGIDQFVLTDLSDQGRQGVVILTNLGNNIDEDKDIKAQRFLETYGNQIRPEIIPVHIISFGDNAKQTQLVELSQKTFGQYVHVATDDKMAEEARKLVDRLRSGYDVIFAPRPGADPERHFSLRVTLDDLTAAAEDEYEFDKPSGDIRLFGVQNLPLGQSQKITAVVTSTYLVESVSYQVNQGQPEAGLGPSYTYLLEGQTTGAYTLTATLTDRLGNRWQQQVPYKVVPGVDVFEIIETRFDEPLRLELVVDQPFEIRQVEVELQQEGQMVAQGVITPQAETPVYLVLRPGDAAYPREPGQYLYRLRITGENDVPAEERFFVRFLPPPSAPGFSWALVSAIVQVLAHGLLIWLLVVWFRNRRAALLQQIRPLGVMLYNHSNVPAAFHLEAKTSTPARPLALQVVGISLSQSGPEVPVQQKSRNGHNKNQVKTADQAPGSETGTAAANGRPSLQLGRLTGWLLPVLTLFGRLPLLGRPFRNLLGHLRRGQSLSRRVSPGSSWLETRFLRRNAKRREPSDMPPAHEEETPASEPAGSIPTSQEPEPPASVDRRSVPAAYPTAWQSPLKFDTPVILQDHMAEIELRVRPAGEVRQRGCYKVEFNTRLIDPAGASDADVLRRQTVGIELEGLPGLYWHFWRLAPGLVCGLIVADLIWLWFWYQWYPT